MCLSYTNPDYILKNIIITDTYSTYIYVYDTLQHINAIIIHYNKINMVREHK